MFIQASAIKNEVCSIFLNVIAELGLSEPRVAFIQLFSMLTGYVKVSGELANSEDMPVEATIKQFVKNFIYGIK